MNGVPRKSVIDKIGPTRVGVNTLNRKLTRFAYLIPIDMLRIKHLDNVVEPDHRGIGKRIWPFSA